MESAFRDYMVTTLDFLISIGIISATAVTFSLVFARIRLPVVVGQILAGTLLGPFGLGLIQGTELINILAEMGVILLLFIIGLELDPFKMRGLAFRVVLIAGIELSISFFAGLALGSVLGWTGVESLFLAGSLAITSTAIVGKIFLENMRLRETENQLLLSVLVVEDFVAVMLLLVLPSLATVGTLPSQEVLLVVLKALILVAIVSILGFRTARWTINLLSQHETEIGEVTFLAALGFGFLMAVVAGLLGFSPATGAFLMGMMIVGKQASFISQKVRPLKDLFIVVFFVSMGFLIDVTQVAGQGLLLIPVVAFSIVAKLLGGWIGSFLAGMREPLTVGLTIIPRGEFSFVIARSAQSSGLVAPIYTFSAGVVLVTAIVGPILLRIKDKFRAVP